MSYSKIYGDYDGWGLKYRPHLQSPFFICSVFSSKKEALEWLHKTFEGHKRGGELAFAPVRVKIVEVRPSSREHNES